MVVPASVTLLHLPPRAVRTFTDAVRDGTRLADADADAPIAVADDDDGAESEAATALDDFGDALDVDHALV